MNVNFAAIRRLVGGVTKEQLRYVDCYVSDKVALFMPVGGACFYALTPEHTHPAYLFVFPFNDRLATKLHGRVAGSTPGRVFALSPGIPHQELPSDAPPRYIGVLIDKRLFAQEYRRYSRGKPPMLCGEEFAPGDGLLPLLKRFMIEAESRMPGSRAVLAALGIEICHSLIRAIVGAPPAATRASGRIEICRAMEHIHTRLDEKLTVEHMASVACLSPSHFARLFKAETGKAPMEYVAEVRLERAKKLLLAGDKPVTAVALACGFGSPSYLSACFQKKYKITPSVYKSGRK